MCMCVMHNTFRRTLLGYEGAPRLIYDGGGGGSKNYTPPRTFRDSINYVVQRMTKRRFGFVVSARKRRFVKIILFRNCYV